MRTDTRNIVRIDRRTCLLLTHAATLFAISVADVRARIQRPPGPFVVQHIMAALADEDRWVIDEAGGLEHADLGELNRVVRRTLHHRGGCHQPLELVAQRLGQTRHDTYRR